MANQGTGQTGMGGRSSSAAISASAGGTSWLSRIPEAERAQWTDSLPKVVLVGLKRSGKSSMLRVLFSKLSPHETNYLEPTPAPQILPLSHNPLLQVRFCEIPGNWVWEEANDAMDELFFARCLSLVLVVDSSDEPLHHALHFGRRVIARALKVKPSIRVELVLNKTDANYRFDNESAQSEAQKAVYVRDITNRLSEDLKAAAGKGRVEVYPHCTSIFDASLLEAFSRIVQRPLLASGKVETLLELLVTNCRLEKALLFDVSSKIHFASDPSQSDPSLIALMQDMLDVVLDVGSIYGNQAGGVSLSTGDDPKSHCAITLANGQVLCMRIVEKNLALVYLAHLDNFDKTFLINYNIDRFKEALMVVVNASYQPAQLGR